MQKRRIRKKRKGYFTMKVKTVPYRTFRNLEWTHYKECGRAFINISYLTEDVKTDTGEKPFACKACRKVFIHSTNLILHIWNCWKNPGNIRNVVQPLNMSRDDICVKLHIGERPCVCKESAYCSSFNIHMRVCTVWNPATVKGTGKLSPAPRVLPLRNLQLRNAVKI